MKSVYNDITMETADRVINLLINDDIDYKNSRGHVSGYIFIPNIVCIDYAGVKILLDKRIQELSDNINKNHDIFDKLLDSTPKSISVCANKFLKYIFKNYYQDKRIYDIIVKLYVLVNNLQLLIFNRDNTINYDVIEYID